MTQYSNGSPTPSGSKSTKLTLVESYSNINYYCLRVFMQSQKKILPVVFSPEETSYYLMMQYSNGSLTPSGSKSTKLTLVKSYSNIKYYCLRVFMQSQKKIVPVVFSPDQTSCYFKTQYINGSLTHSGSKLTQLTLVKSYSSIKYYCPRVFKQSQKIISPIILSLDQTLS